ncbi:hypothetical protein A1507_19665 [Methylomonas koyamae]|uniref:Phosphatase n=1 Tax=Methylomonas koyamae TaxID=702114 RepID=A0A177N1G6_9GAMM|nr:alkaline phosphatase PhoX [Methylomonas koyamae]OAI11817.1 hypothetical protein A1507_19665 [Methylomonas koyamae]
MNKTLLASLIAMACANAHAIGPFTPLTASATSANTSENTNPFKLPAGWVQTEIVDVNAMNALFGGAYPATFRAWDMLDIGGANHQFLYIPHEVQQGAGVTRFNRDTGVATILMQGNNTGIFDSDPASWDQNNDDFGAFDPAVLSPWNTLLAGEEWAGNGRLFEMLNPETATGLGDAQWRWLSSIPSVSHEGLKFDKHGNLYFIDEDNSGSIYKFVPKTAGDLSVGQTFVLKVTAYNGQANQNYNHASNTGNRTGAATWVAITDADGNKTTTANPFNFTSRGGRAAADEVQGTPYGRPEDLIFGTLANGNQALYVATTSEQAVYSIELNDNGTDAIVREFAKGGATKNSAGNVVPAGSQSGYGLGSPDNLAIDADGNIFINEDQNPGDVWMATDADKDGVAEKMDMFMSLGPFGSEPTGFIADPRGGFLVNIQHPASNNDALWSIRPDGDGDGIADNADNCSEDANANQRDSNNDGYGNVCDADLNNDGSVNQADAGIFRGAFGSTNADADLNGDGIVNQVDNGIFRSLFGAQPGPSGVAH